MRSTYERRTADPEATGLLPGLHRDGQRQRGLSALVRRRQDGSVNRKAAELLADGRITARLQELQEGHQKRHEVTVDRIVAELSTIAFASAGDFFDWGPNGVTVKDKRKLSPEQVAVVSEVSQTITEAGGTIRVKLHSKVDALDKLARHFGMYKELRIHELAAKDADEKPADIVDLVRRMLWAVHEARKETARRAGAPPPDAAPASGSRDRPTKH
jgi:hypothetical protein